MQSMKNVAVFAMTVGDVFALEAQPAVAQSLAWTDPEPLNNNAATDTGDDLLPQVAPDEARRYTDAFACHDGSTLEGKGRCPARTWPYLPVCS